MRLTPSDLTVDAGASTSVTCHISGNPVSNIIWVKDGQPISLPDVEIRSNTSIFISSTSSKHQGIYQCLAENDRDGSFAVVKLKLGGKCFCPFDNEGRLFFCCMSPYILDHNPCYNTDVLSIRMFQTNRQIKRSKALSEYLQSYR